jgi:vancomycin resistance protein YoaR
MEEGELMRGRAGKLTFGWLTTLGLCAAAGGVVAVGLGFAPKDAPPPPADKAGQPTPGAATTPPAGNPPGSPPTASPAAAPPVVDPRVARALETRVCLQAGTAKVWTEVRRLGVALSWSPESEPQWSVNPRLFDRALRRLARRVERQPRNARLLHSESGFRAVAGHGGRRFDRGEARRLLLAALAAPDFRRSLDEGLSKPSALNLKLPLHDVYPTVTTAHLGRINTLLASYSTGLGGSSSNRRHNIRLACQSIDGAVLLPGDVFSYNDTVGPRSERTGFRIAPVIIRGELVPGTGGGICQVSTTLYNAALLADLKIVRRSHHQFPVHYVPPGRDATVAYGSLDLRFANSLPDPVALDVKCVGSRVIVHVYGTADCRRSVRLVNSRVAWTRPRARAAVGARPGKRVTVSRIVQLANGTVRREVISHDTYAPAPASARSTSTRRRRRPHRTRSGATVPGGRSAAPPAKEVAPIQPAETPSTPARTGSL